MDDEKTEDQPLSPKQEHADHSNQNSTLIVFGIVVWSFVLIGFVWFFDYRSDIAKIIGFLALGIGALSLLNPSGIFKEKYQRYAIHTFFILSVLLIIISQ